MAVLRLSSRQVPYCALRLQLLAVVSADFACNPDFNVAQIGVVTRWTPVKNLTFSAEVGAFLLDQKYTGADVLDGRNRPEADRDLRVQGPEHCVPERSRSA